MKVLYLVCMEITQDNDIHANQVLSLAGREVDYSFLFLSPKFILNRAGFSLNRNLYNKEGVKEVKLPILSYHFSMHIIMIPYYLIISMIPFLTYLKRIKPDIVHCRNLLSTLLAVSCKRIFDMNYKIVCDPRSVYVEEQVIQKAFRYNGFNYRVWKKIESYIYKKSDVCIGLSHYFKVFLQEYNKNSFYIPAVVNDSLRYNENIRKKQREIFNLTDKDFVCCYIGSIGTWHSVDNLLRCIDCLKKLLKNEYSIKIIFLSGNKSACEEIKNRYNESEILKVGRVAPSEISNYLYLSDIGLVPGSEKTGCCYDLLYDTMVSSKAEEYLCAGLPIMVHPRIKSLVKMVNDIGCGIVLSDTVDTRINVSRERISEYSLEEFSITNVTISYKKLYDSLMYNK